MELCLAGIEFKNFKSFKKTDTIKLKKINLIFGNNSAGKSTILQIFRLLKQSLNVDKNVVLQPRSELSQLDLGDYAEMINCHDVKKELGITFYVGHNVDILKNKLNKPGIFEDYFDNATAIDINFSYDVSKNKINVKNYFISHSNGVRAEYVLTTPTISDITRRISNHFRKEYSHTRNFRSNAEDVLEYMIKKEIKILKCVNYHIPEKLKKRVIDSFKDEHTKLRFIKYFKNELDRGSSVLELGHEINIHLDPIKAIADHIIKKSEHLLRIGVSPEKAIKKIKGLRKAIKFYSSNPSTSKIEKRIVSMQKEARAITRNFLINEWSFSYREQEYPEIEIITESMQANVMFEDKSGTCQMLSSFIEQVLKNLSSLGAHSDTPRRDYISDQTSPSDIGHLAEKLPQLLFRDKELLERVNSLLKIVKVPYKVKSIESPGPKINDPKKYVSNVARFQLRAVDIPSEVDSSFSDIGSGITKLLAIITQTASKKNSLLLLEEPESHCHPKLIGDLAKIFREGLKRHNMYIVETHSEHLILRIQKMIRDGELKKEDVSILYIDKNKSGSKITPIKLNAKGDFINSWPGGFFPERYKELL